MNLLLFCLLLVSATGCTANKATGSKSVTLQPWLVGLTAVVGFLVIVFAILIIHRLLKRSREAAERHDYYKTEEVDEGDFKQTNF